MLSETMGTAFNPQTLVEKLTKLNNSQQSIETLSQWCIFHIKKAKLVVETWARQFRCSRRDQRLAFLYLANDILQNSRRRGLDFVGEFWKVLPEALHDVIDNTDESSRNAALRLVNIWEERKVFGSRGQILKEELVGRHLETSNRNEKHSGLKLSAGNALDKIVSGYQYIYGGQIDEDAIISKCKINISCVEKAEKEFGGDLSSVQVNGLGMMEELRGHNATLKDGIEQLSAVEALRINLVCYLREALQEQEMKLDQVSNELKAAHTQSEKADNLCRQLLNPDGTKLLPGTDEQSAPLMSTQHIPISDQLNDNNKSAAAAVEAKLAASASSAEMFSYVLSSFASEGAISNSVEESSLVDHPPDKRAKIENVQNPQPPVPSESPLNQQPPPPSSPLPPRPLPPMQAYPVPPFPQTAGSVLYGYTNQLPPPSFPGYPTFSPPINSGGSFTPAPPPTAYQTYQMEGGFSTQPMAPMSRQ